MTSNPWLSSYPQGVPEYDDLSLSLCAYFQNIAGLAKADRITLMMPDVGYSQALAARGNQMR